MSEEKTSPRRRQPTRAQVEQLPGTIIGAVQTRVYLAVPKAAFGTWEHDRALARVGRRFPGAKIIDAATAFRSSDDWRRRWPRFVLNLHHVVFVSFPDQIIGAGVFQEILDAQFRGIPVEYLTASGSFVELHRVGLRMQAGGDATRFAEVRLAGQR